MMDWILARLKEKTTWVGLVSVAVALGVNIAPEAKEAIATAGVAIVGAILAVTKEGAEIEAAKQIDAGGVE